MKNILSRSTFIVQQKERYSNSPTLLCAISGGQDSIFLLILLKHLERINNLNIHFLYCNHFWQYKNFYAEIELLKFAYLLESRITITLPESTLTTEEVSRLWRQKCFCQIASFFRSKCVLIGHTGTDEIETAIWHLFRGTSPKGLVSLDFQRSIKKSRLENNMHWCGSYPHSLKKKKFISFNYQKLYFTNSTLTHGCGASIENAFFVCSTIQDSMLKKTCYSYMLSSIDSNILVIQRPLLDFYRANITHGVRENRLPVFVDHSNQSFKLMRNKIRLLIIPLICFYINSSSALHVKHYLKISKHEQEYLDILLTRMIQAYCAYPELIRGVSVLPSILQSSCLKFLMEKYTNKQLNGSQIERLLNRV